MFHLFPIHLDVSRFTLSLLQPRQQPFVVCQSTQSRRGACYRSNEEDCEPGCDQRHRLNAFHSFYILTSKPSVGCVKRQHILHLLFTLTVPETYCIMQFPYPEFWDFSLNPKKSLVESRWARCEPPCLLGGGQLRLRRDARRSTTHFHERECC